MSAWRQRLAMAVVAICLGQPAHAQRGLGLVALIRPVAGIVVDGDLGDWPADIDSYAIRLTESGQRPTGPDDFTGSFVVGYDGSLGMLYLAVSVIDDSHVLQGPEPAYFNNRDGCEVFLHLEAGRLSGGYQFVLWGTETGHFSTFPSWQGAPPGMPGAPRTPPARSTPLIDGSYKVAAVRSPKAHLYEWGIDVTRMTRGEVALVPWLSLGLDVAVCDLDADGSFSWMAWSRGTQKLGSPTRVGRGLLLSPEQTDGAALTTELLRLTQRQFDREMAETRERTAYQMFLTGVLLSVTFLHLLLFLYHRPLRANLHYALFTGVTGGLIYYGYRLTGTGPPAVVQPTDPIGAYATSALVIGEALLLVCILGLLFLYSLFFPRRPRRFWVLLVLLVGSGVMGGAAILAPTGAPRLLSGRVYASIALLAMTLLATALEMLRVVLRAVRNRQEGAWMMGVSFLVFGGASIVGIATVMRRGVFSEPLLFAVLLPLACMSLYLARSVSRTRHELEERNQALEAASERLRFQYEQIEKQNRRIQTQNEQIQAANRLKSEFLARMSHDLRTPMNAIIGYTRILLRKTEGQLDPRQQQNLQNISISAQNLLALINDILDISKIEAGQQPVRLEAVALAPLVAECLTVIEPLVRPEVRVIQQVPPELTLRTDREHLRRILANLLSNAARYTEAGSVTVGAEVRDGWLEIAVRDTGVGIPAADLPFIFDEFRQVERADGRRPEGTGLGLAIVRRTVGLLGGQVTAASEVGRGSVFTVRLPVSPPVAPPGGDEPGRAAPCA